MKETSESSNGRHVWWRPNSGPQMRAVCIWPDVGADRDFVGQQPPHQDAFWIEATPDFGDRELLPRVTAPASDLLQPRPDHDQCNRFYLVTRDLSAIVPFVWWFPIASLWNAYSPFRAIVPVLLNDLSELAALRYTLRAEGTHNQYQLPY